MIEGSRLSDIRKRSTNASDSRTEADPDLAGLADLLLPDRHAFLQPIDHRATRGERFGAMRRRRRDHHRELADREHADPVLDRDARAADLALDLVAGRELENLGISPELLAEHGEVEDRDSHRWNSTAPSMP